jgi:ribosomal protein S18 acetylase RimI-like enzyme
MAEGTSIRSVRDDRDLAALLDIYRRAIPRSERRSDEAIAALLDSPAHRLAVADRGGEVVGFYVLFVGGAVAMLEYLAIRETARGGGLGSALYRHARSAAGALPLLVEVESDRAEGPERSLRSRRKAFYRRLGCRELAGLRYRLPLGDDPPAIDLLVDSPSSGVKKDELETWLREIYTRVYGCAADDPRLAAMLAPLPEMLELAEVRLRDSSCRT